MRCACCRRCGRCVIQWDCARIARACPAGGDDGSGVAAGVWGLRFGARAELLSTEHTFMVLAFERSTYVYQFAQGQAPRVVSDTRACEWHTDAQTLYACTMFDGDGVVQVRPCRPLLHRRCRAPPPGLFGTQAPHASCESELIWICLRILCTRRRCMPYI